MQKERELIFSNFSKGLKSLVRRKQVDSVHVRRQGHHQQLARKLSAFDLTAIGITVTINLGYYCCFYFLIPCFDFTVSFWSYGHFQFVLSLFFIGLVLKQKVGCLYENLCALSI